MKGIMQIAMSACGCQLDSAECDYYPRSSDGMPVETDKWWGHMHVDKLSLDVNETK